MNGCEMWLNYFYMCISVIMHRFPFCYFFSLSAFKSCIFIKSLKFASIRCTVCSYLTQLIYRSHLQCQLCVNNDYLIQSQRSKCNIINPWDNQELDDDSIYQFWYVINARKYRRGNQQWTVQRNWKHRVQTQLNMCRTPRALFANKHT